jgi:Flp pilus assembly pilin Flp
MRKNKLGQSTLEYAVIIAVVVAALLAIQIYMKRGVQGKLRESTDSIGEQYSAGYTTSKYSTTQAGNQETKEEFGVEAQGVSKYSVVTPATITTAAEGADAETVTRQLRDEKLFP